jgi:hypothetical protein
MPKVVRRMTRRIEMPRAKARRVGGALGVLLALAAGLSFAQAGPWPDTLVSRLEALALIETLNAEILASRSATLTLEKWCADHGLAGVAGSSFPVT